MLLEPSDGELQQSRCWGLPAPYGPPLWRGSAQLRAWHTTSPLTASSCRASAAHFQRRGALSLAGDPHALSEGSRRSLHAGEGARPLWLRGRRGRRAQVQASDPWPPHTDPPPHYSPPAPRNPREHPRRAAAERPSEPPNFAQLIAAPPRVRGARRPSPSMAHYLTVPTPTSRRPLRGLARAAAPGAGGPAPGRCP